MSADHPATPALARLRQARAQQETVRRWLRLLGPLLFAVLGTLEVLGTDPRPGLAGHGLVVSAGLAGLILGALGVSGTFWLSTGPQRVFLTVLAAASVVLMWAQPRGPGSAGVFLAVVLSASRLPRGARIWVPAATLLLLVVISEVTSRGANVPVMILIGCLYAMSLMAYRLGEAHRQAEQLLAQREHSRAMEAQAAGLAERQRLAGEMHDVLAHSLSGLMLQLEAARMLAAGDPGDPRLPEAVDRAHHLGKTGLAEARRAIGMLRGDELPGPERLTALAAQFQQDRGIPCQLSVSGRARKLGSEARLALYRVAQEALTNIAKHARPEQVEMRLAYLSRSTRLTIEDFTAASHSRPLPPGDTGYGLTGMRERAELLGGTLITETTCSGFRVELEVPE